jgi:hypothetical protein
MTEGKEKMGSIMFKPCPRFHIQIDSLLKWGIITRIPDPFGIMMANKRQSKGQVGP